MNPRQDAYDRLAGRYEVRVLEPSPPTVSEPPFFADDPVARGHVPSGRQVVSPVSTGDLQWDQLAAANPALAGWCADRWLGAYRRLAPAPPGLPATRVSLHRVAEHVVSPARRKANGKIGLRFTRGGFGTPFFGEDMQVRVAGTEVIVQRSGTHRSTLITSLAAIADHVGRDVLPADIELAHEPLDVDPAAAAFLGEWYGFAASVLEELRVRVRAGVGAGAEADSSRVQLWPEHFDLAIELGPEQAGARAAYGLSPGDEAHPEPYLYVAPWGTPPTGELWQGSEFSGAELSYATLLEAEDQRRLALEFFGVRLAALVG